MIPNVVPARFSPDPQKFQPEPDAELKAFWGKEAHGYTLQRISYLENQLHKANYKRDAAWQGKGDEALVKAIKVAKTARTIMLDRLPNWAGNLNEEAFVAALPKIWNEFIQIVVGEVKSMPAPRPKPELVKEEGAEEALNLEDVEPIRVINRPEVPADAPRSVVIPPKEPTLGEILGKIAKDNTD